MRKEESRGPRTRRCEPLKMSRATREVSENWETGFSWKPGQGGRTVMVGAWSVPQRLTYLKAWCPVQQCPEGAFKEWSDHEGSILVSGLIHLFDGFMI